MVVDRLDQLPTEAMRPGRITRRCVTPPGSRFPFHADDGLQVAVEFGADRATRREHEACCALRLFTGFRGLRYARTTYFHRIGLTNHFRTKNSIDTG